MLTESTCRVASAQPVYHFINRFNLNLNKMGKVFWAILTAVFFFKW